MPLLSDGGETVILGQENIARAPWQTHSLETDGNQEYAIHGTAPMMGCIHARMSELRFSGSQLVMPLTNDGITWPRSGFVSAPFPNTAVDWYVRDGEYGSLNSGLGVPPGAPLDLDSAPPMGTGANDAGFRHCAGFPPSMRGRYLRMGRRNRKSGAKISVATNPPSCRS
jgi:hypothetical protein